MDAIDRLERAQWDYWWISDSLTAIDQPELCYIYANRAKHGMNVVVRFRAPDAQVPKLMDQISDAYRGKDCKFCFYPHHHGALIKRELQRIGFAPSQFHDGRVLYVDQHIARKTPGIEVRMISTFAEMKELMELRGRGFGIKPSFEEKDLLKFLKDCTEENARTRQFLAYDSESGKAIAQAGLALHPKLKIGFFFAGATLEGERGKGAYSALVNARVDYARSSGFDMVGLFAVEDTSSPILAKQGFLSCGKMIYWKRDDTNT